VITYNCIGLCDGCLCGLLEGLIPLSEDFVYELDPRSKIRLASAEFKYLWNYKESNNVQIIKKCLLFKAYKSYCKNFSQIDAQKRENWF